MSINSPTRSPLRSSSPHISMSPSSRIESPVLDRPEDVLDREGIRAIELSDAVRMLRGVRRHVRDELGGYEPSPSDLDHEDDPSSGDGGVSEPSPQPGGGRTPPAPPGSEGSVPREPPELIGEDGTFGSPKPGVRRPRRVDKDRKQSVPAATVSSRAAAVRLRSTRSRRGRSRSSSATRRRRVRA